MLTLLQGDTTDNIVVTLKEKTTLTNPYYLMVCEHITTKDQVIFILGSDLSSYPDRYNEFVITVSRFTTTGQYLYKIYEQASSSNLDPTGLNMVENGRLQFVDSTPVGYVKYSPVTQFKTYAG